MKLIIATIAILAISSLLLVPVVSVYADTALPMTGSQWAILELVDSKIKTTHADTIPSGGVQFSLPDATGSPPSFVNLLTNGFTASLATSNTLTAKIQVVASSGNRYVGNPDGSCPVSGPTNCPGTVRLYFTSNLPQAGMSSCLGTNGNSQHTIVANEFDYWWSNTPLQATDAGTPGSYYQFSPGGSSSGPVITLGVSLDPGMWSDLCGTVGSVNVPAFMASISNIKDVGLSFGSGFFFENGVGVDGTTGSATFQLTSYTIT